MLDRGSADDLLNATVYDTDDNKIGRVGRVYLDDLGGRPEWVTVQTGLFGTKESFLPLGQARLDGERLIVPIAKDAVKHAPHIDPDAGHLSLEEEEQLYRHYGLSHGGESGSGDHDHDLRPDSAAAGTAAPMDAAPASPAAADSSTAENRAPETMPASTPPATPPPTAPAEQTGMPPSTQPPTTQPPTTQPPTTQPPTTQEPAEQTGMPPAGLRLRRHLVTEDQQITVPVVREEYILEPDPGTGGSADGEPDSQSHDQPPATDR